MASAQCTTDPSLTAAGTTVSTTTCLKNLTFTPFCSGGNTIAGTGNGGANPSGVAIIQVNVGTNTGLMWGAASQTAGFFPELALISGTCDPGNGCLIDYTNGTQTLAPITAGTAGSANPGGTNQDPLPAGTYFAIVTALSGTACGNYTFTLAGTLPVKLEKFSVD